MLRLRLAYLFARFLGVPIAVRDTFWLGELPTDYTSGEASRLFYDKNGDKKGGAVLFVVLEGSPNDLSKADFFVI